MCLHSWDYGERKSSSPRLRAACDESPLTTGWLDACSGGPVQGDGGEQRHLRARVDEGQYLDGLQQLDPDYHHEVMRSETQKVGLAED